MVVVLVPPEMVKPFAKDVGVTPLIVLFVNASVPAIVAKVPVVGKVTFVVPIAVNVVVKVPAVVKEYLAEISKITGRNYAPFQFYGAADATEVIIAMGSVTEAIEETVDFLNENGSLTVEQTLQIMNPVVSALAAAHKIGIIHRDIKPENILVCGKDKRIAVNTFV